MIVEKFVSGLEGSGPRGYYQFETFVHHLFKHHLEAQNKSYYIYSERDPFGDAVAPNGIEDLDGPVLIEIKFNLSRFPPDLILNKILERFSSKPLTDIFSTLLIISAKQISEKWLARAEEFIARLSFPFKVEFWGPAEINKIANKNRKTANQTVNSLFSLRLESAISEPKKDWKQEREEIIERLKDCYKKGQFSLFLGAGVSSSAGMPDWNTLLSSLFVTYLTREFNGDIAVDDTDIEQMVARLNGIDEPSALMAARYLRKGLSKQGSEAQEFINAVTKNLYKLRNREFPVSSELIKSVASMCLPRRTGAKVRSVVTYNFDDLLERQLSENAIQHRCIYTESEVYDPDELPIYHVHGFLPEKRNNYDGLDRSTLVFSEEGYHRIYTDSYHWSNLVQLNSFRESNCLMVGLSMTDPNLRRLLDISSRSFETCRHFSFMKRLATEKFSFEVKNEIKTQVIDNIDAAGKFLDRHHALNEELMKELGVTIIWYESYDEIPEIINRVSRYES